MAELYFFGFTNVCYREDNPAVRCLEFVNFGLNHNYKRCVHYDLDESKLKRYQFFDVPYFNISNAIEEFAINKFFKSLRANYSEFLQYVEEREKYTETLKRKNTLEQYVQMNNETNECFSTAECLFPFRNRYTHNDDVQIHCDCDRTCYRIFKQFKSGNFDLEDEKYVQMGRPQKFKNEDLTTLLNENSSKNQEEIAKILGVRQRVISYRLKKLGFIRKAGNWVPSSSTSVSNKKNDFHVRINKLCIWMIEKKNKKVL